MIFEPVKTVLYGIKNCDTIKKARKWLEQHDMKYTFHDYRSDGITQAMLKNWLKIIDWEILLNTRSSTWRSLPDKQKSNMNESKAISLMLAFPTLIKRPVLQKGKTCFVGFKDAEYKKIFK